MMRRCWGRTSGVRGCRCRPSARLRWCRWRPPLPRTAPGEGTRAARAGSAVAPAGLWGGRLAASGPLWEPSPLPGPTPSAGRLAQAGPRAPGLPPMDTEPRKPAIPIHPLNSACSVLEFGPGVRATAPAAAAAAAACWSPLVSNSLHGYSLYGGGGSGGGGSASTPGPRHFGLGASAAQALKAAAGAKGSAAPRCGREAC